MRRLRRKWQGRESHITEERLVNAVGHEKVRYLEEIRYGKVWRGGWYIPTQMAVFWRGERVVGTGNLVAPLPRGGVAHRVLWVNDDLVPGTPNSGSGSVYARHECWPWEMGSWSGIWWSSLGGRDGNKGEGWSK